VISTKHDDYSIRVASHLIPIGGKFMKTTARLLALSALAVTTSLSSLASAQSTPPAAEAEAAEDENVDGIIVTGTRIPSPEFEGIIPGAQVTAVDIEQRGFTNVLEALNDLPLVGPGATPIGNAGGQPASLGAAFVDLLDLGTARTLTLVNGRRFVSGNAGSLFVAANATGSQVDLNSIPTELVERIDVLTVGGAVAYGADAIAGVVNLILKDDYTGGTAYARSGISSRSDAFNYQVGGTYGVNFSEGRGNIAMSLQYNHDDGLQGSSRSDIGPNFIAPTFFGNGGRRNTGFTPAIPIDAAGLNNAAFLRAADDGVPGVRLSPPNIGGSILVNETGRIFQYLPTTQPGGLAAGSFSAVIAGVQAGATINISGATQIVPGVAVSGATAAGLSGNIPAVGGAGLPAGTFTRFAPTALPTGVTAAQVITALAPSFVAPAGTTPAQLNTLAINLLQANRPTPREYLAQNPNTPINAFLGSFVPGFLDQPNTDAASAAFLPRTAVPLQFDAAGNVGTYTAAAFGANTPATLGGAPGGDFYNPQRYTVVRTEQDRYIGNLIGRYDLTDNIRFYTENLVSRIENFAVRNGATTNNIAGTATETAALVVNLNNPYLTAANRSALIAAGVPTTGPTANLFVLSRVNQDILGDNAASVDSTTLRTVNGFKGQFGLFGREFNYDASFAYGRNKAKIVNRSIRDIEFALALDAVNDANGNTVCRVNTLPAGTNVPVPLGVINSQLVRTPGPDGVLVERIVQRTVTPQMISGCRPLNPFGFDRMSQASKDYVTFLGVARNKSEQLAAQATLATSSLFDLPGGGLGFAANAEWRTDKLDYQPSEEQQLGVSRTAGLAATKADVTSMEGSLEFKIPIFGDDFTIPLFRSLVFTPGVRFVKQDGNAPDVRRLNGVLETNKAKGSWETLYSLAGTWKPIEDIQFRGNYTRSIRQPSVVELFLGNQSAFNTPTDPCGIANIGGGNVAATRRANCEQEVVRLGIAADRTSAAAFLNTFVPQAVALQGGFAGSPTLKPEKGTGFTYGVLLQPRFIKNLTISADYINVKVRNQIIPTGISQAAQFCYDSATFNDTSSTLGVNTCSFFTREATTGSSTQQFNFQNGFASGFINLGALQVKAINGALDYKFDIADVFGGGDKGNLRIGASVYHLMNYISSAAGDFSDNQDSAGSFPRPKWETQLTGRYENNGFFASWTWNWVNKTKTFNFNTGAFNTIEQQDVLKLPSYSLHDATIGADIGENFRLQFTVRNVFDKQYAGSSGFANASSTIFGQGQVDQLGRRFQATARVKF
jgi:outer membrane receptor protein involved in Fe transport